MDIFLVTDIFNHRAIFRNNFCWRTDSNNSQCRWVKIKTKIKRTNLLTFSLHLHCFTKLVFCHMIIILCIVAYCHTIIFGNLKLLKIFLLLICLNVFLDTIHNFKAREHKKDKKKLCYLLWKVFKNINFRARAMKW